VFQIAIQGACGLSGILTGKAGATLILVMSISLFQVAVFLTQPKYSSSINVDADSQSATLSQAVQTVTLPAQTVTFVSTVEINNTATVISQLPPRLVQDYTPFGIAVVVAVAMFALVIMFLRRRR